MNHVTDLTAETVAFITLNQDIYKNYLIYNRRPVPQKLYLKDLKIDLDMVIRFNTRYPGRIGEIIWSGTEDPQAILNKFLVISEALFIWLKSMDDEKQLTMLSDNILDVPPNTWRDLIRNIFYRDKGQREKAVEVLHYMPLQVILAMCSKKPNLQQQRLYQIFQQADIIETSQLLREKDKKSLNSWWDDKKRLDALNLKTTKAIAANEFTSTVPITLSFQSLRDYALMLLGNDELLYTLLLENKVALPFESLFTEELKEINKARDLRKLSSPGTISYTGDESDENSDSEDRADPAEIAFNMNLCGLALSGGGIRSATFNLGLIQKLAALGLLPRLDYISTVSGGGYIGTWLSSWIKRGGTTAKIAERLDPGRSSNPLADETRPIRWLRMYSNYLAPNASLMSRDSWTVGITWLRNMLVNQSILLLLLVSFLAAISAIFQGWKNIVIERHGFTPVIVWVSAFIAFGVAGFLAGKGMESYHKGSQPKKGMDIGRSPVLVTSLLVWGSLTAYLISGFFASGIPYIHGLKLKIQILYLPCTVAGFISMIYIALQGKYYRIGDNNTSVLSIEARKLWAGIIASTLIAALAGGLFIALSWQIMEYIYVNPYRIEDFEIKMIMIFGVPLILESVSMVVVVRMMIMGNLFPDDRREWWGRMGAVIHRLIFAWILVTSCALIIPDFFSTQYFNKTVLDKLPALFGGWLAIVLGAVKLAFQSSDKAEGQSGKLNVKEIFVRFAPYLFMLGFLLLGAYTLEKVDETVKEKVTFLGDYRSCRRALIAAVIGAVSLILSWRVGINEFSLHHFYKNRLVRAFLGATRRRTERDATANHFTGFDLNDDIKLAEFRTEEGYDGPYPLINTALNATNYSELDRQDRKAESFIFTPFFCGFDFSPTRSTASSKSQLYDYGYRPTEQYASVKGPLIGTAMAISGAAVNPNMGYHSSAPTAFLLTVFNVRLGWWIGNPCKGDWERSNPRTGIGYLVKDLIGKSDINTDYVCLSDGGHFDNMGIYELVRRRCRTIILSDAEEDPNSTCEGLANAIRRCRIDFGVEITINNLDDIVKKDKELKTCISHMVEGTIKYPDISKTGRLIYIKTSLTGKESVDIREYSKNYPDFPQQSTGDQFFDEAQFESYRKLGFESITALTI